MPTHMTVLEAIGWLALNDPDAVINHFNAYRADLYKWKVSDKHTLLECLTVIENKKSWSLKKWQKESEHNGARLDIKHVRSIIKKSGKSVSQLKEELGHSIENDICFIEKTWAAEKSIIQAVNKEKISLRGIHKFGNGHPEILPLAILIRPNLAFDRGKNTLVDYPDWDHIQISDTDFKLLLNETKISEPQNEQKHISSKSMVRLFAAEQTVYTWFTQERLPLHKTEGRHPSRDNDWRACQEFFKEKARQDILKKVRRECLERAHINVKRGRYKKSGE